MAWYATGTINLVNGSTAVVGNGTSFIANVDPGEAIIAPDGRLYEIVSVNSDTALTLATAYLGSTVNTQSYRIVPVSGYTRDLARGVGQLVADYSQSHANRVQSVSGRTGVVTKEQLLTDLKTIDGTGSGLDADTVDGLHIGQSGVSYIPYVDSNGNLISAGSSRSSASGTITTSAVQWVKIATLPSTLGGFSLRLQINSGYSEEVVHIQVETSYFPERSGIKVERQSYGPRLLQVAVAGNEGGSGIRHVYAQISATGAVVGYTVANLGSSPSVTVSAVNENPFGSIAAVTLPTNGKASVSNHDMSLGSNVGIGVAPNTYPGFTNLSIGSGSTGGVLDIFSQSDKQSILQIVSKPLEKTIMATGTTTQGSSLSFLVGIYGNSLERMRITSGGNVLIGTTTDNGVDKLQVNGSISASNFKTRIITVSCTANTWIYATTLENGTYKIAHDQYNSPLYGCYCDAIVGEGKALLGNKFQGSSQTDFRVVNNNQLEIKFPLTMGGIFINIIKF